ncbi:gas vesicle protein GvpG [Nodosilinea sp. P-1105]|uniref:gas vesicle protein GvpG n=1 Tax=Nodosilinea sp. P-1105 TaxID=2546229 RepID=UPI00146DDB13|nr:gas vesicle protein GvpG [Nodosilinea sp. P-1105]NMF82734.1 gas vesicle protein GvpG [Nodosilinea sp. P-1105]
MLLKLLFAPVLGPVEGVSWIADKILEQADVATNDMESLQKQLLTLQMSFDMGDVSEEDFEAQEEEILLAMQAIEDEENGPDSPE